MFDTYYMTPKCPERIRFLLQTINSSIPNDYRMLDRN